ncbi:cyclase [Mycobacterium sp. ACS1612]|uniref:ATP-binding protein n=1 Tax=Mycobacterium sp. ACS1612 TaxID=1834117 RepID=UPI000801DF80|nr:adenylate/guanylate cyclase domain-containing protein [Mycobacterium sp. ACS1612]OBF32442.1 cyclase [Mycobacterium sp. ACS1612]
MTATGVVCAACGAEASRAGARFCDACGSPLNAPDAHAEYKQVTVLFADVVRSMDLAAALGAERLREVMTALVESCAAVVKNYGGTVDKFTGDGIMAVFGAPIALEDHAVRACLAAQDMQRTTQVLAAEVDRRDAVTLQIRIGLNSGEVIVGEIGSGALGYTAIGDQVGMAQRMESVAPPGGVMVNESTARLVASSVVLDAPETVHIRGFDEPVTARKLLQTGPQQELGPRAVTSFVGRRWEMAAVEGVLDRSVEGHGSIINVVGPAGIGKSRIVAETSALASSRGIPVFFTYCESHAREVPFQAVSRLLRAAFGVEELADDEAARSSLRARVAGAQDGDLVLLEDLLAIREPGRPPPDIDPDARRRRLTALVNAAYLAQSTPSVYVVENAHWIDTASESLLADFLSVAPQTASLVMITHRPEYVGTLSKTPGAQTIALAPLNDSESTTLIGELLGTDPSVAGLTTQIAERARGNPFFAQEIVRDLAERRVLLGERGAYVCPDPAMEVSVPASLQAAIAARIDRLDDVAKQTLNAAAVIGLRFDADMLAALVHESALGDLVRMEFIDQVRFTPRAEYAFHHPLIRTVAYESQLKADRAVVHRRLATAIEQRDPVAADENAALIAEHLEAADDLVGAYRWHMRAGGWLTIRDTLAADACWRKARQVADRLPAAHPDRMTMRIAPRTLMTGGAWRVKGSGAEVNFDELRELCEEAGDKRSLAIGMTGVVMKHALNSRYQDASRLAAEHTRLLDAIDDPELTVSLSIAAAVAKYGAGEPDEALRLAQRVIDLAGSDAAMGSLFFGSPLALAIMLRGCIRSGLGIAGWRADFDESMAMARGTDAATRAIVLFYICLIGIPYGVVRSDGTLLTETAEALEVAGRSGAETTLSCAMGAHGVALVHRESPEREEGLELLEQVRKETLRERFSLPVLSYIDVEVARVKAECGELDEAIEIVRPYARRERGEVGIFGLGVWILVESLLRRGGTAGVDEAEHAVTDLAAMAADPGFVIFEVLVLRLRALLARAHGDESAYRDLVARYRTMSESHGYEGHLAMAATM